MEKADLFKDLVLKRTGLKSEELQCPRETSEMTPCIARDGSFSSHKRTFDTLVMEVCVGCGQRVDELLFEEQKKHES